MPLRKLNIKKDEFKRWRAYSTLMVFNEINVGAKGVRF
jgi:hypothetical protein